MCSCGISARGWSVGAQHNSETKCSVQTPTGGGAFQRTASFYEKSLKQLNLGSVFFSSSSQFVLTFTDVNSPKTKVMEIILSYLYFQEKCKHRAAMFLPSYCTKSWTVLMLLVEWEKLVPLENKSLHYIKIWRYNTVYFATLTAAWSKLWGRHSNWRTHFRIHKAHLQHCSSTYWVIMTIQVPKKPCLFCCFVFFFLFFFLYFSSTLHNQNLYC